MSEIDKLINSIWSDDGFYSSDIERIMKEYAEYYAKECLKLAEYELMEDIFPTTIILPPHQ
jgi:hypothetical protein